MFLDCFSKVEDPRIDRTKKYPLIEVLLSAFFAVMDGARSWNSINTFASVHLSHLRKFLPFENGIPSEDTYARVFSLINPDSFEKAFREAANRILASLGKEPSLINIDGKQMRGATEAGGITVHLLSAWCHDTGISLGQMRIDDKSNEIPSIPVLLDQLAIEGATITIDAMGTQKEIAKKIIDGGADYVLAVKGNQPSLQDAVIKVISNYCPMDTFELPPESARGYVYERKALLYDAPRSRVPMADEWVGLRRVARIICTTTHKRSGKVTEEIRNYILSNETFTAKDTLLATRHHWDVENGCHWQLDCSFKEDDSRKYKGHSAENFSRLLRTALNCVKAIDLGKDQRKSVIDRCKIIAFSENHWPRLFYRLSAKD